MQIPLIKFSDDPSLGIYINWDRINTSNVQSYNILKSNTFNGEYSVIDSVAFPINEYIDANGTPTDYYKIQEIDNNGNIISTSGPMIGEEELIKTSLAYEIQDFLRIPVHDEEPIFYRGRTSAHTAYANWNYYPRPEIRISGINTEGETDPYIILSETEPIYSTIGIGTSNYEDGLKYKIDYASRIYFIDESDNPVPIYPYDYIYASYNVRFFTVSEMNNALNYSLQMINLQPGVNKIGSLRTMPVIYDPVLITGATYWLLRNLATRMQQKETQLLLTGGGGADAAGGAGSRESSGGIDISSLLTLYKDMWQEQLKLVGKYKYPNTLSIVTPEYMMPGSRSRYFRYMWKSSG